MTDDTSHWFLYIVENKLNQFYTGVTVDIARRLDEHRGNGPRCAKALRGKQPLVAKLCLEFESKNQAMSAEVAIKRLTRRQKEDVIENEESQYIPEGAKRIPTSPFN